MRRRLPGKIRIKKRWLEDSRWNTHDISELILCIYDHRINGTCFLVWSVQQLPQMVISLRSDYFLCYLKEGIGWRQLYLQSIHVQFESSSTHLPVVCVYLLWVVHLRREADEAYHVFQLSNTVKTDYIQAINSRHKGRVYVVREWTFVSGITFLEAYSFVLLLIQLFRWMISSKTFLIWANISSTCFFVSGLK